MKILGQNSFWIINKDLAKEVGIEGALLLSDLIDKYQYFLDRGELTEDGFFYNTIENIEKDTTLSNHKQKQAIKILKDKGYIETKLKGIPAKLHFKIIENKILNFLKTGFENFGKQDSKNFKTNNNKDNNNINNNNKDNNISKDILEQSSEIISYGKSDINEMQEIIKHKVFSLGLIYKKGSQERNRIQNILTAKDFGMICEKANMSRIDFVINIIELSTKLEFWKGKIYNAETLYKHYASVYNEAVRIKTEKEINKGGVGRV